ncbi:MAG: hypothetical protein EA379_12310 [Phycisphaerales bacterium]|nr:MAG: hypothetical protein EA379_12310 [Phycisphaerales bacterium]
MRPTNARPARPLAALTAALAAFALGGCANNDASRTEGDAEAAKRPASVAPAESDIRFAVWSPSTDARVVTIEREALFTVADGPGDLLVIRTQGAQRGVGSPYHTWVVALDAPIEPGRTVEIGRGARAWLLHHDQYGLPRAAGVRGSLSVHQRAPTTDDTPVDTTLRARLSLATDDANVATPGVYFDGAWMRVARSPTIQTTPIATRSGVAHRERIEEERRPTHAVWPWEEIFGDLREDRVERQR